MAAQRLPTPGAGTWGTILNDFLEVSLASDGTLNPNTVGTDQLQSNAVTNAQLDSLTQAKLVAAGTAVQSVNSKTGTTVTLAAADVSAIPTSQLGAVNGVATLNSSSQLTASQLPGSVANGSSVGTGFNGLAWNGSTWVETNLQTTFPGVVADATGPGGTGTDNYATIQNYLNAMTTGGETPRLPLGKIGISAQLVIPTGVTLLGLGSDSTDISPTYGTVLVPLAGFTATNRAISVANSRAGIKDLSIDVGTQCYGTVLLGAADLRLDDVYLCGGTLFTLDSNTSCQHPRLHGVRATPHPSAIQTSTAGVLNSQGADWQADSACYFENGSKVLNANNSLWNGVHFVNASGGGLAYGLGSVSNANIIDYGGQRFANCYIDSVVIQASTALIDRSQATSTSHYDACTYDQSTTAGGGVAGAISGPVFLETATASVGAIVVGGELQVGVSWTFTEWVQAPIASTIMAFLKIAAGVMVNGFADTTTPLGVFYGVEIGGVPANIGLDISGNGDPNTTSIPGEIGATYRRTGGALGSTLYTRVASSGATNAWARPSDLRVIAQTASFTVGLTDDATRISTAAGAVVATLGTGSAPWPPPPRLYRFIKSTSDANQVTFSAGTGSIQGTSPILSGLGDMATFLFDGTNWFLVAFSTPTKSVITSLTSPPISGTTYQNTTGRDLDCYLNWTPGSSTSDVAISLSPDNVTFTQIVDPHSGVTSTQSQFFRVPAGWYYKVVATGTGVAMNIPN